MPPIGAVSFAAAVVDSEPRHRAGAPPARFHLGQPTARFAGTPEESAA
jgi:hypothetical protein